MAFVSIASALMLGGCNIYKVVPPEGPQVDLRDPVSGQPMDFLIETVDLIDRQRNIGRVGDTFWGGQYQVVLDHSLKDYFESEVANDLINAGFKVFRSPGEFAFSRIETPTEPLRLTLELQTLTLARHPKTQLFADHILGTCKIRSLLSNRKGDVLYQRQFVGRVDTYRPTDELVIPGVGLISRKGLSTMLQYLLRDTVDDFQRHGLPEIRTVFNEFREGKLPTTIESTADDGEASNDAISF
jgi:hypothetical protein